MTNLTPHAQANEMLLAYQAAVARALPGRVGGIYVYGSLASGDYDPATSDIDAVTLVTGDITPDDFDALARMHAVLAHGDARFSQKFEAYYMPPAALRRFDVAAPQRPRWNAGRFYLATHGGDWVIHRKVLLDSGIVVEGPPLSSLIDPVTDDEVKKGIALLATKLWEPYIADPARINDNYYQMHTILTMCRTLSLFAAGNMLSKRQAAHWGWENLPQFKAAIESALHYKQGNAMTHFDDAMAMIKLAVAQAKEILKT